MPGSPGRDTAATISSPTPSVRKPHPAGRRQGVAEQAIRWSAVVRSSTGPDTAEAAVTVIVTVAIGIAVIAAGIIAGRSIAVGEGHTVAVAAQAPDALIASVTVVIAVQILVGIITAGIIAARHPGRCGLGGAGKCQGRADCEQCFLEGHNSLPKKCARCNKHRCAKIYFWRLNPV